MSTSTKFTVPVSCRINIKSTRNVRPHEQTYLMTVTSGDNSTYFLQISKDRLFNKKYELLLYTLNNDTDPDYMPNLYSIKMQYKSDRTEIFFTRNKNINNKNFNKFLKSRLINNQYVNGDFSEPQYIEKLYDLHEGGS